MKDTPQSYMMTTFDNPFDPINDWDNWLSWDRDHGYYTNEILARAVSTSIELSEADYAEEVENAIDRFVLLMPETFKKVGMPLNTPPTSQA